MQADVEKLNPQPTPKPGLRGYWWTASILVGLSLVVMPFDFFLAHPTNLDALPGDLTRVIDLSEIFAHGFGLFLIAVGICVLAPTQMRFVPRILMCAIWSACGVQLLKLTIARNRPICYFDDASNTNFPASIADTWIGWMPNNQLNVQYGFTSFPSAHTATAWGLAIGMSWAFPKGRWLFFSIAALASLQRVTSFAHWPSDVLIGAAIAFMMAGAITHNWGFGYWFGRFENRNSVKLLVAEEEQANRKAA